MRVTSIFSISTLVTTCFVIIYYKMDWKNIITIRVDSFNPICFKKRVVTYPSYAIITIKFYVICKLAQFCHSKILWCSEEFKKFPFSTV